MTIEEYSKSFHEIKEPTAKPLWVRDFKQMTTHIRGNRDIDLIAIRRPNEPEDIYKYRIDNYRAVTRGPFNQAITNLVRTLNHSAVSIKYPEDISAYLSDTNFHGKTFLGFFESEITRKMIEAANAFLVWWPTNVGDSTQRVEMKPIIVYPERVKHFTAEVFTWLSDEKSEVISNNKKVMEGEVYYCILKDELCKRIQVGKKSDKKFVYETYYANPTGMIYAMPLGGDIVSDFVGEKKDRVEAEYYTSFFSSAVPFADECLVQFSDHQGTLVSCSFPIREMEQMACNAVGCHDGKVNGKHGPENCMVCNGTGRTPISQSPYGVIIRPPRTNGMLNNEVTGGDIPVMRYIHPDVSILDHGAKVWQDHLKMTKEALNLLFIDESQSGIAKETDREDKVATLDKIGRHLYNYLIKNSIQYIFKFTFPEKDWPYVPIILPATFVPKTQAQLQEEVKTFREMNTPDIILASKMREMMRKSVNGDPFEMKIYDLGAMIDPLFLRTLNDKMSMAAVDAISDLDLKRSNLYPSVIRNYANEQPDAFMDATNESLVQVINEKVDSMIE